MSQRVDLLEVINLSERVNSTNNGIQRSIELIKKNCENIIAMDSFTGETADAMKRYLGDYHHTILDTFAYVFEEISINLKSNINVFQGQIDSNRNTIIHSDYFPYIERNLKAEYNKFKDYMYRTSSEMNNISDIISLSRPTPNLLTSNYTDITKNINELKVKLRQFENKGKSNNSHIRSVLHDIESSFKKVQNNAGSKNVDNYEEPEILEFVKDLKDKVKNTRKYLNYFAGFSSSYAVAMAAKRHGLHVKKYVVDGKDTYRIHASEKTLKELGIKIDPRSMKNKRNKWKNPGSHKHFNLQVYEGKNVRNKNRTMKAKTTRVGNDFYRSYSNMKAWNPEATNWQKTKTVGKAALKGIGNSLLDVVNPKSWAQGVKDIGDIKSLKGTVSVSGLVNNIKNSTKVKDIAKSLQKNIDLKAIGQSSVVKGAVKVAAPVAAGLSYYSNFHDAKADNLTDKEAHERAVVDTVTETVVAAGVQAGSIALFTVAIPIPGVGTAVGIGAGIGLNTILNKEYKILGEKSAMDHLKGGVRKLTGWFK